MSDQQSIERQEREFTELLQRVLQAPLSPITASVQELKERIDQLEHLVRDMLEIELSGLTLGAEDTRRQIRSLKILSEETPREIQNVLQPLFEQFQAQLLQVGRDLEGLNAVISAGQGAMESMQKQGFEYLENIQQTALAQLLTKLESLRGEVGSQFAAQLSQLRPMLNAQQEQLERQHAASSGHLGAQMQNGLLSLRKWVIASVCMAAASLAGVITIAAGRL